MAMHSKDVIYPTDVEAILVQDMLSLRVLRHGEFAPHGRNNFELILDLTGQISDGPCHHTQCKPRVGRIRHRC